MSTNKETVQHWGNTFHIDCLFKAKKKVDMLSLVFKKLNLCPVMPASQDVNPLATSHTVEHLLSMFAHNWSHDKPSLHLISHCLNKIDNVWKP